MCVDFFRELGVQVAAVADLSKPIHAPLLGLSPDTPTEQVFVQKVLSAPSNWVAWFGLASTYRRHIANRPRLNKYWATRQMDSCGRRKSRVTGPTIESLSDHGWP